MREQRPRLSWLTVVIYLTNRCRRFTEGYRIAIAAPRAGDAGQGVCAMKQLIAGSARRKRSDRHRYGLISALIGVGLIVVQISANRRGMYADIGRALDGVSTA
jgi:hypothetical protein